MQDDAGKLKRVEFHGDKELLFASLDRPVFDEIVNLIKEKSDTREIVDVPTDTVSHVLVHDASRPHPKRSQSHYLKDRVSLLVSALFSIAFGIVFGMGLLAIGEFIRQGR